MNLSQYLDTNPLNTIPQDVLEEKRRLTAFKDDKSVIFGSYMYRFQKYPGDIDILERVEGTEQYTLLNNFAKALQRIVEDIISQPNHYFSEIKCGVDKRFDLKVGEMINGSYRVDPQLRRKVKKIRDLFDMEDYHKLMLVLDYGTMLGADSFDTVIKIIRSYYILRWTADEILMGQMKRRGEVFGLYGALKDKTMVKIDEYVFMNGKFIEITNVYGLTYMENGKEVSIYPISDINVLTVEIEKMYYSNMHYAPFKMIKRMYSFCRFKYKETNDDKYIDIFKKIVPILKSTVSLLYQIVGDYKTLLKVSDYLGTNDGINKHLDNSKLRLSHVVQLTTEEVSSYSTMIDNIMKAHPTEKNKKLEHLIEILTNKLNFFTIRALMNSDINPPPELVLPTNEIIKGFIPDENFLTKKNKNTYDRYHVREPSDKPVEEYEEFLLNLKPIPPLHGYQGPEHRVKEMILRQLPFNPYN